MNYMLAPLLAVLCLLQACGGATATTTPATTPEASQQINTGLSVRRVPAGPLDGYMAGLTVTRDATGLSGGIRGHVNATSLVRTISGADVDTYEWAHLSILDNFARAGENVAAYAQANRYGDGPTWASVSEVADFVGSNGGVVGHEVDVWTSGSDTGSRIGVEVVLGDIKAIRGTGKSDKVEGSAGLRIGAFNGASGPRWTRGVQLTGRYIVGIDLSTATHDGAAIRLGEGQAISLDATDSVRLRYQGGRVVISNGATPIFEIDAQTGDVYKRGVKVL